MLEHKDEPRERQRVWVNADKSKVVEAGSEDAAFMLHAEDAEKLGLTVKEQQPAEDKAVKPADVSTKATPTPTPKAGA